MLSQKNTHFARNLRSRIYRLSLCHFLRVFITTLLSCTARRCRAGHGIKHARHDTESTTKTAGLNLRSGSDPLYSIRQICHSPLKESDSTAHRSHLDSVGGSTIRVPGSNGPDSDTASRVDIHAGLPPGSRPSRLEAKLGLTRTSSFSESWRARHVPGPAPPACGLPLAAAVA